MVMMTFSEFCGIGQPIWFRCSSQAQYLKGLFKAAGITRNYSDDYLKAVYEGKSKKLNSNMKKHFPLFTSDLQILHSFLTIPNSTLHIE